MVNCAVPKCSNKQGTKREDGSSVGLFGFPNVPKMKPFDRNRKDVDAATERRRKWIRAMSRQNTDGSIWEPNQNSRVCGAHFVSGQPINEPLHPDYVPSLLLPSTRPSIFKSQGTKRYERAMARGTKRKEADPVGDDACDFPEPPPPVHDLGEMHYGPITQDKGTQTRSARSFKDYKGELKIFMCMPANITAHSMDMGTQVSFNDIFERIAKEKVPEFRGMETVLRKKHSLWQLTSVEPHTFQLLLLLLEDSTFRVYETQELLLMFLMKLRLDITFTALAVIFNMNKQTLINNFYKILDALEERLQALEIITWLSKEDIQESMPKVFKEHYPNCRAIIDCTEVKTQKPKDIYYQNMLYSSYKHCHTLKFLISIAPNGLITYISSAMGGRTTDPQATNLSNFLQLLSKGDLIMADRGFPNIKTMEDIIAVIPPDAPKCQAQFTSLQLEETRKIASLRIHVERVIQRLKVFRILSNRFSFNMLRKIDKIIYVCAALVNMSPPIIKSTDDEADVIDEEARAEMNVDNIYKDLLTEDC